MHLPELTTCTTKFQSASYDIWTQDKIDYLWSGNIPANLFLTNYLFGHFIWYIKINYCTRDSNTCIVFYMAWYPKKKNEKNLHFFQWPHLYSYYFCHIELSIKRKTANFRSKLNFTVYWSSIFKWNLLQTIAVSVLPDLTRSGPDLQRGNRERATFN